MITNQKVIIEKWLRDHGSITGKQAMDDCGVYRLSAVIYELRKRGIDIETNMIYVKNRYNGQSRIAQYKIKGNGKPTENEAEKFLDSKPKDWIDKLIDSIGIGGKS
jgi:hypothetical protein